MLIFRDLTSPYPKEAHIPSWQSQSLKFYTYTNTFYCMLTYLENNGNQNFASLAGNSMKSELSKPTYKKGTFYHPLIKFIANFTLALLSHIVHCPHILGWPWFQIRMKLCVSQSTGLCEQMNVFQAEAKAALVRDSCCLLHSKDVFDSLHTVCLLQATE